jgi:hypothetical protein
MSTPKIKTFEGACKALKLDPVKALPKVSGMPKRHQEATIAHAKLVIIAEALNEGWKPDWKNGQWDKWYPWFWMNSGSGLSLVAVIFLRSASGVGSRLCFKSRELAEYAFKKFKKLYEAYFLIK